MKRPHLLHLTIFIQCLLCIGVAAIFIQLTSLSLRQTTPRDAIDQTNSPITSETRESKPNTQTAYLANCAASNIRTIFEDRPHPGIGGAPDGCVTARYQQAIITHTCTMGETITHTWHEPASDWLWIENIDKC